MKYLKYILTSSVIFLTCIAMSGCENTHVSGSVSYGMGMGYGYPMYYGHGGRHHTDIIVVKPPRAKPRPSRPVQRPSRPKRR